MDTRKGRQDPGRQEVTNTETREEYIARVVAEAPPISDEVMDRLAVLLRPGLRKHFGWKDEPSGPSEWELKRRKEADERAATLARLKKEALALTACHGCGLQPEQHTYQSAYGMGYHEWEPIK